MSGEWVAPPYWHHDGDCAAAVAATEVRRLVTRERDQARADLAAAQAREARVRALHQSVQPFPDEPPCCEVCSGVYTLPAGQRLATTVTWPCPTIRALDGTDGGA